MSDLYESHGLKGNTHSNKIFPFPSQPTVHSRPEQAQDFSLFPSIVQRAKNHAREPSARPSHPKHRIFSLSNNFTTPQRIKVKPEPTSLSATESHDYPFARAHVSQSTLQQQFDDPAISVESHQFRFMPIDQRSSSRAPSETPSAPVVDADSEDLDLSEMMNRRMKEAKVIKVQLAEERVTNANLQSQLFALQSDFDKQKDRLAELEAVNKADAEIIRSKDFKLHQFQAQLDEAQAMKDSQLVQLGDKDDQILAGLEKLQVTEDKLKMAEDRVTKVKDTAKRGIENMSKNFDSLKHAVEHLKTRFEISLEMIPGMRDELEHLRLTSSQSIKELEPFMDPSSRNLIKATETRDLIRDLQTDRNNAQQVIDLLRDKLHNLSTQLVESNEKVAELESHRKEERSSLARSAGLLETTGQQVAEITSRLRQREREDADLMAEGLKLEIQLTDANHSIGDLSKKLSQKQSEVDQLLEQKMSLTAQLQHTSMSLEVVSNRLKEATEECVSYRQTAQTKSEETSVLVEKLRVAEEARTSLQNSARKDAVKISDLEDCVRLTKAGEASATAKNKEALDKIKHFEEEKAKLKRDFDSAEEDVRKNSTRLVALQERFDSQTMTLKLTKEHSGDLQERLLLSEKAHATKLESVHGQYKAELAVLEEQKNNLQNLVGRLRDDVQKLESTIDKLRTDHASVQMQKCTLHADLERLKEQMTPLESTLEKLSSLNSTLAEERTSLQVSLDRYRQENLKLESSADAHILEISSLQDRIAVLQDQLSDLAPLKEEHTSLQFTLSTLKSENAVLHSEKAHLQENVDKHMLDVSELRRTMERNRTELSEVQEQRAALRAKVERLNEDVKMQTQVMNRAAEEYQAKLAKQEETSERSLNAEVKRVEAAEQGLGELTREITKRLATMESKLELSVQMASVDSPSSGRDELLADVEIGRLKAEIIRLEERETSLEKRYREGELNEVEKEFVNSLIKFSQDMHEKEMVEKENDLRRRDNMVTTLQHKITKLESTLAKCLKSKGKPTVGVAVPDPKAKSMLDLNMWMSSSPLIDIGEKTIVLDPNSNPAPTSTSTSCLAPVISMPPVSIKSPSFPVPAPAPTTRRVVLRSPKTPTFSKLDEDISDFEEDQVRLMVKLGKRNRPVSPMMRSSHDQTETGMGEGSRPARRSKIAMKKETGMENQVQAQEKVAAGNTKVKSRKRR